MSEVIPSHLKKYIVEQDYSRYTAEDQAVWRYTLRQLKNFLSKTAHQSYLEGLEKTGISIDRIPSIIEISKKLEEFGWRAVPVSGFIPPAAFMEMQSLGILPIASDMRTLQHILYTPAPDIVHEAAGHAPILVDPDFADYLKEYAYVAKNALISKEDLSQYEAIRELSDIKENPNSTKKDIVACEVALENINASMTSTSEAALLGRMNWWTAEYGLFGELDRPKIFGAGLLSSFGESRLCLKEGVEKIPLTVDCVDYSYDITEPQPQLFVTKDFKQLKKVLNQLSEKLAYKRGGTYALEEAIEAKTVNTVVLDSGLEVSGPLVEIIKNNHSEPIYFRMQGPTQLCTTGKELKNQGVSHHPDGFSTPLGVTNNLTSNWKENSEIDFRLPSGVQLNGFLTKLTLNDSNQPILATFKNCKVTYLDRTLFDPDWGIFDMAIGEKVTSVYAGPADRASYGTLEDTFTKKIIPRKTYTESELKLHELYSKVRKLRESSDGSLEQLLQEVKTTSTDSWLLTLELYEIAFRKNSSTTNDIKQYLAELSESSQECNDRITDGLSIAHLDL